MPPTNFRAAIANPRCHRQGKRAAAGCEPGATLRSRAWPFFSAPNELPNVAVRALPLGPVTPLQHEDLDDLRRRPTGLQADNGRRQNSGAFASFPFPPASVVRSRRRLSHGTCVETAVSAVVRARQRSARGASAGAAADDAEARHSPHRPRQPGTHTAPPTGHNTTNHSSSWPPTTLTSECPPRPQQTPANHPDSFLLLPGPTSMRTASPTGCGARSPARRR